MYNKNIYLSPYKYFYYTWKCISRYTRRCTMKMFVVIIREDVYENIYLPLYKRVYNTQISFLYMKMYFCYTRRCIMKMFVIII